MSDFSNRIPKETIEKAFDQRFPLSVKRKFQAGRVAIAGLGGLGSNIAISLARSGVGNILLVDFDKVDITNLNRQVYRIPHIEMKKTEALKEILMEINPYINIEIMDILVTENNAKDIFHSYPIVCEAFDNPKTKAMLVNTLFERCPDTTVICGNGMAGISDANNIKTTHPFKRLYVCGDGTSDVENGIGLVASRVAICAGHQSNKVLQLLLES